MKTKIVVPIMAFLSVICAGAQDAQEKLVTVETDTPIKLCSFCPTPEVRFPVKTAEAFKPSGEPRVLDVSLAGIRRTDLIGSFTPKWEKNGPKGRPTAILIAVSPALTRTGVYDLLLDIRPASPPRTEYLKVQIEHAAARLQVPPKITVRMYRGPWWHYDKSKLELLELSRLSPVSRPRVVWSASPTLGTLPVAGTLEFPAFAEEGFRIGAGESKALNYKLGGHFPAGTVNGSLQISADELAEPVTLNYEVITRYWTGFIVIYTLLGLAASMVLKVVLKNRIQLGEARQKASQLHQRLRMESSRYADAELRRAINQKLDALSGAIQSTDVEAIEKARQDLETAWRDALQFLATRREKAQKALDDIRAITDNYWTLPAGLSKQVMDARECAEQAKSLLANDDVSGADMKIGDLGHTLGSNLRATAVAWQDRLTDHLTRLTETKTGVPEDVRNQLKPQVEKLRSDYLIIKLDTPIATPEERISVLATVATALGKAQSLLQQLQANQHAEAERAVSRLHQQPTLKDPVAVNGLDSAATALSQHLVGAADDPAGALQRVDHLLHELHTAWEKALLNQLDAANRPTVEAKLNICDYAGALAETIRLMTGGTKLLGPSPTAGQRGDIFSKQFAGVQQPINALLFRTPQARITLPDGSEPAIFQTGGQLLIDKALQSGLLAVLIGIGAVSLYSDTFVGNFADFSKIFFWAFGLDVTIDAVRELMKAKT